MDFAVLGMEVMHSQFPEGSTPLEAIVSVKIMDAEGNIGVFHSMTETLSPWEAIGMSQAFQRFMEREGSE